MIEQIKLALINESGDFVPIKTSNVKLEMKIEMAIAETFSEICKRLNDLTDEEIKLAEKFNLAKNLKNYLEEMNDANTAGN
jgi:predicted mannosyl-3-phosphoglycerate phosphatase (HAD superfamily)